MFEEENNKSEQVCTALLHKLFAKHKTLFHSVNPQGGLKQYEEFLEIFGRAIWDIFSDNHEVTAEDGQIALLSNLYL